MNDNLEEIPIFIINLDRDIDKNTHMRALCTKYGLSPIFIEAVNGGVLTSEEIEEASPRQATLNALGRELSKGEVGCAMSHKLIYRQIIDKKIKTALVIEDDVFFDKKLVHFLKLADKFPKDLEVLLLGHHRGGCDNVVARCSIWGQKKIDSKYMLMRPIELSYGTYGYCITNKGARKMLQNLTSIRLPIDHYTGDPKFINIYALKKRLVRLEDSLSLNSSIEKERDEIRDKYRMESELSKIRVSDLIRRLIPNKLKSVLKYFLVLMPVVRYK
jgi:glycosyl transferase, family 25